MNTKGVGFRATGVRTLLAHVSSRETLRDAALSDGLVGPGLGFGNIWFVNATKGSDGYSGEAPTAAKKTITAALAKTRAEYDDYVIINGAATNFYENIVLTKNKVHLIGTQGQTLGYRTRMNNSGAGTPTITVKARDCELAGISPLGDRTLHQAAVFLDGDNGGIRTWVHDLILNMITPSAGNYCDGILSVGERQTIEDIIMKNCKNGIRITSGVVATFEIQLRRIVGYANDVGILIDSLQEGVGQHGLMADDIFIDGYQAAVPDVGVKVTSGFPAFRNMDVGGYGVAQVNNITVGSGRYTNCRWFPVAAGVSTAFA